MQKNTVPSSENVTNKSRSTEGLPQSNRPGGARRRSFLQGFGLFGAALSAGALFPAIGRAQPSPAAREAPSRSLLLQDLTAMSTSPHYGKSRLTPSFPKRLRGTKMLGSVGSPGTRSRRAWEVCGLAVSW